MDNKKEVKPWLGHYRVVSEEDHPDLEARAAIHEFRGGLPRDVAEQASHFDYLKDQAYKAAAHHLLGIRAAVASGHDEAAKRHGESYATAIKAAGHSPLESPPQKVLDYINDAKQHVYSYHDHPADQLFQPVSLPEASSSDEDLGKRLGTLKALKDRVK
jgi:hypothetical protein